MEWKNAAMRTYRLYQVDAFTREKWTGDPAGVVPDARGLDDKDMLRIAREMNNSETAFVFPGEGTDYDVHVRFFTPTREVPLCGHATVAAHYVLAREKGMTGGRVYQKTGAGILPVDIQSREDDVRIVMTQGRIEYGDQIAEDHAETLLKALGLHTSDLVESRPLQIVSTGHSKVMVPIRSLDTLHALRPDNAALIALSEKISCNGYYVFTADWADSLFPVHGRMFAPAAGIPEDPVTGNANGPLGAYLVHHRLVEHDGQCFSFDAIQGESMLRPGVISVEVTIKDNEPALVKISGNAVIVFKTEISV